MKEAPAHVERIAVTCIHSGPPRPPLALGMCLAHARAELDEEHFDLEPRFVRTDAELEQALALRARHVLLFSNYVWNVDRNLELSRRAKAVDPHCITIHGGPSTPAYEGACQGFLEEHSHVDYCVRGEGESALVGLLAAIQREEPRQTPLPGVCTLHDHALVRGPDCARAFDLDHYPSPYLTGLFDELDHQSWESATLETNRGCPYGCTFCDWGSATLQKLRRFSLERVQQEIQWLAERRVPEFWLADANFGILPRDLQIAEMICDARKTTGFPKRVVVNYAKNTHRHLVEIVELFVEHGLVSTGIVSLQTRDEGTLETVRRKNIRATEYDKLRSVFARKGLPLTTQLMVGLPGSDIISLKSDLRSEFGGPVDVQLFRTVSLPNSPMADPAYVEEQQLEVDGEGLVLSSATFTGADMDEMSLLSRLFRGAHTFGLLRYALHYLEWDHGLDPLDVLHELARDLRAGAIRGLALRGLIDAGAKNIDLLTTHVALREERRAEASWAELHSEFFDWARERFGISDSTATLAVQSAQTAVMPAAGRTFPDVVHLEHDVEAWLSDRLTGEGRELTSYGPAQLFVRDPWDLSSTPLRSRAEVPANAWELDSDLRRSLRASSYSSIA